MDDFSSPAVSASCSSESLTYAEIIRIRRNLDRNTDTMYDDLRKNELDTWNLPSPLLYHPYPRPLPPLPSTLSRRGAVSENNLPADVPYMVGGIASVAAVQLLRCCLRNTPEFHKSQTPTSLNNADINRYLLRQHESAQSDMAARLATCVWTSAPSQLPTDTTEKITIWGTKSTGTDGAFSSRPESSDTQDDRSPNRRIVTPDITSILRRGSTPKSSKSTKSRRRTQSNASPSNDGIVKWNEGIYDPESPGRSRSPDDDLGGPSSPGHTYSYNSRKQSLDMCSCPDLGREEDEDGERPGLPRRRTDGPQVRCPHHPYRGLFQRSNSVCPGELHHDNHRIRDPRSRRRLNREDVELLHDTRTGASGPLVNAPAQEYSPKLLAIAGVMIATGELDRLSLGSNHSRSQSLSQISPLSIGGAEDEDEEDEEELPPLPPIKAATGGRAGIPPGIGTPMAQGPFGSSSFPPKRPAPRRLSEIWNASWEDPENDDSSSSDKRSDSPGLYDMDSPRYTGPGEDNVSPGGGANPGTPRLSWPPNLDRVDQSLREQDGYFGETNEEVSPQDEETSPGLTETQERRNSNLTLRPAVRPNDGSPSDGNPSDSSPSTCECTHCENAGYFVKVGDDAAGPSEHKVQLDEEEVGDVLQRSGSTHTVIHTPTRYPSQDPEE
ncbi:hypothetical protein B0T20DRAFT_451362 [Sordaria brevicollis]|uniref:Uncharacterized protein n=1 Tax=Sordaria brevicollis TaxID=83679 RepID=A0AAE0PIN9_SORBR|nr:hypothetical protein B0T20DRAFT_451362 [Sordaria brevicollis]